MLGMHLCHCPWSCGNAFYNELILQVMLIYFKTKQDETIIIAVRCDLISAL